MWVTYRRGRDAITGWFIPIAEALKRKRTAVVERIRYWRKTKKDSPTK